MVTLPPGTIEAFGLYVARSSALVLGAPLLGMPTGFAGYKIVLILALSFLLYSTGGVPLTTTPDTFEFALLTLREIGIGLALSFSLHAVLVATRVAGELIGQDMGFSMAQILDPATGTNSSLISQSYEILFFLGFLLVDGHHLLMRALGESFARAPVGALDFGGDLPFLAVRLFQDMFVAGLTFAAPVLVLLSLMTLILSMLARAVPQLNVNELGYAARISMGLIALFIFAPLVAPALNGLYGQFMRGLASTLDALGT